MTPRQTLTTEAREVFALLLTAEIVNKNTGLDANDIPPRFRGSFGINGSTAAIKRPTTISEGLVRRELGIEGAYSLLKSNPFVIFEEFGGRMSLSTLDAAAKWFHQTSGDAGAGRDGQISSEIRKNPVLAWYYENSGLSASGYQEAKDGNPLLEDSKDYLESRIRTILADNEEMRTARDLIIITAPEEMDYSFESLVCTPRQEEMLRKIEIALKNRDFLSERRIYEFGKLLFIGPPGTGKTSFALAMSKRLHMPVLEVRLAMVTSQYLGETSKNIDRIFDLARRLSPCILFIDEFDFVAKSRMTEDNAAMKRAVNMLLKNIDTISFVKNGVLLIGATNHAVLLDEAAWRRFDEVVEFPLPDQDMRRNILQKVTATIECDCDYDALAARTDGFSGADLRIMIKEALISALMRGSHSLGSTDIEKGISIVKNRERIRQTASG